MTECSTCNIAQQRLNAQEKTIANLRAMLDEERKKRRLLEKIEKKLEDKVDG